MSDTERAQAIANMLESFKRLNDTVKQAIVTCQNEAAKYDKVKEEGGKRTDLTAMMTSLATISSITNERMSSITSSTTSEIEK